MIEIQLFQSLSNRVTIQTASTVFPFINQSITEPISIKIHFQKDISLFALIVSCKLPFQANSRSIGLRYFFANKGMAIRKLGNEVFSIQQHGHRGKDRAREPKSTASQLGFKFEAVLQKRAFQTQLTPSFLSLSNRVSIQTSETSRK